MIDMILPETLLTGSLRYFADFRFADLGDSMTFNIEYMNELKRRTGMSPETNFDGSLMRFAKNPTVLSMADDIRD